MARARLFPVALFVVVVAIAAFFAPAFAQEWLDNGGFETGTDGWVFHNAVEAQCEPRSGGGAFGIDGEDSTFAEVFRELGALPAGTYTVSGWSKFQSGTGAVNVTLLFGPASGSQQALLIATGATYQQFSFPFRSDVASDMSRLRFGFQPDGFAVLCLDDLSVTSEDTATSTPTPSDTPAAATSTSTATDSVAPTATATPTLTPTTTATASLTPTSTPTSTPGPSFVFTNGGFEDGLTGWSKYGGALTTTSNALSGATAGLLVSDTESTKWAYQAVHVDPAQFYEFSANVQADGGVSEAYLRISWYETADASGSALATSDSLQRTGPAGYTLLTTGPVQPPPEAASARLRVLLAPASAAPASLGIDDAWFGTTAAPTPTATASPTATPSPEATATPSATETPEPSGTATGTADVASAETQEPASGAESQGQAASASGEASATGVSVGASPVRFDEVAGARSGAQTTSSLVEDAALPATITRESEEESSVSWPWVAGAVLLLGGLGGAYLQSKRATD